MLRSLAGIRVADFSESLAGPFCTQILADLGAEVIKIERPRGDAARTWGPAVRDGQSAIFIAANRGKRSIAVDLRSERGRDVVARIVERSDVVVQSFRAGVMESLGLGAEQLRAARPGLIYCSITAFGTEGPMREARGYDPLAQAYGGLMSVTGHPGAPPVRLGISAVDMGTGMWAALAIVAALRERDVSGKGAHVETSLLDTSLTWMSYHLIGYLESGKVPGPQGSQLDLIAPYEAFPTTDGWLMIAAATDVHFARLCSALEVPHLAEEPEFGTNLARVRARARLSRILAGATSNFTVEELAARLRSAGVPCSPIHDVAQVAGDEQVRVSGMLTGARTVAAPYRVDGVRSELAAAPALGEHTAEILQSLGFDPEHLSA